MRKDVGVPSTPLHHRFADDVAPLRMTSYLKLRIIYWQLATENWNWAKETQQRMADVVT
jgi:hypothetical protein